ncbi:MAG TPA: DUF4124 domain-containing protein [Steroidobacteraceae bacterium]|jgi:multidrug efflux pump subunit AcrA (membrane-fusion protein)|nr:DUF4124 domain-containing protein [Steroidobacteraceae bacterium]
MRISPPAFGSGPRSAMTLALLALTCAATPLAAQEVYKTVDADGHVVYSDRGATKSAPKTTLHVEEPDPAEVARLAREQDLLKADEQARTRQQAINDKNKAQQAQQQRKQQQACEQSRNHYYYLKDSTRIYQRDADGNRVYLSDEAADATREQARRAMTSACGS